MAEYRVEFTVTPLSNFWQGAPIYYDLLWPADFHVWPTAEHLYQARKGHHCRAGRGDSRRGHAGPGQAPRARDTAARVLSWPALYPGFCVACENRFEGGTDITWAGTGRNSVRHAGRCPLDDLEPRRPVCAACNLEHAGECW